MITKEQILSGCELWLVGNDGVRISTFNRSSTAVKMVIADDDYFTTKEEAEEVFFRRMLVSLNDN